MSDWNAWRECDLNWFEYKEVEAINKVRETQLMRDTKTMNEKKYTHTNGDRETQSLGMQRKLEGQAVIEGVMATTPSPRSLT